jgi:ABC-type uncharacterized transport system auxiliary subunit
MDNIFVEFRRHILHEIIVIHMGINCAPPLADLFLYSYASHKIEELQKLRYIDDVLSINNPYFAKKLDSTNIHITKQEQMVGSKSEWSDMCTHRLLFSVTEHF